MLRLGGERSTGSSQRHWLLSLAAVLALNTADGAMIGALAAQLESIFHMGHTRLGLLAAVSSAIGVVFAPVAGALADRARRVRLLVAVTAGWGVAMAIGGIATTYWWLVASQLLLGALFAAGGPIISSLTGDLFAPADRGRVYGLILTGELVGSGVGFLGAGALGVTVSWRAPFFVLAALSLVLAALLAVLSEPHRGRSTPSEPRFWPAVRYILSITSVRRLVLASAVGYFFFAGLRTFALVYVLRRFQVSELTVLIAALVVGAAALAGTVLGGRIADALRRRGHVNARLDVPAVGYVGTAVVLIPAFAGGGSWLTLIAAIAGGCLVASANPPLDAARLDVVSAGLWGRAESVRTVLRLAAEAAAPLIFGVLADRLAGPDPATGLSRTFLIMLVPLAANGWLVWLARRTYATDAAAAQPPDPAPIQGAARG